jgi:hypothetical protein
MIHQRQRLTLSFEPGCDLIGSHAGTDDLDRYVTTDETCFGRLIHRPHSSLTEYADDFVRTDVLGMLYSRPTQLRQGL